MIVVLNKNDKDKIKEIVKEDEVALNIVDNINEEIEKVAKKCNRLCTWGTTLGALLIICSGIMICSNFNKIIREETEQKILYLVLFFGGFAISLTSLVLCNILEANAYKLTMTEKELEYLNLLLKENAIEKKYSVKKQSDGKVWYYKAGKLMDAEYDDKRQISNVVYLEYYELKERLINKIESFHHFEPALYNKCY